MYVLWHICFDFKGIKAGLDVLNGTAASPLPVAGGKMLVITDGEENRSPTIEEVLYLVRNWAESPR